jgi:hypothetical protein
MRQGFQNTHSDRPQKPVTPNRNRRSREFGIPRRVKSEAPVTRDRNTHLAPLPANSGRDITLLVGLSGAHAGTVTCDREKIRRTINEQNSADVRYGAGCNKASNSEKHRFGNIPRLSLVSRGGNFSQKKRQLAGDSLGARSGSAIFTRVARHPEVNFLEHFHGQTI